MEIFGIGGFEIALIVIIALVVAGPARMAVWARTMGRWAAKIRQMWTITAAQLQRELDDAGVDFKIPKDMPTSRKALVEEIGRSAVVRDLKKPVEEIQSALAEGQSAIRETEATIKSGGAAFSGALRAAPAKPAPVRPNPAPVLPSPAPAQNDPGGFGTWGGGTGTVSPSTPDLGTWGSKSEVKDNA